MFERRDERTGADGQNGLPGNQDEKQLDQAYNALLASPGLSPDGRDALRSTEKLWDEFRKSETELMDGALSKVPLESREAYEHKLVQDRTGELQALLNSRLTPGDPSNTIDRTLGFCLGSGQLPVLCLADAENSWQILKNNEFDEMYSSWKPEALKPLESSEENWQNFAQEEDRMLSLMYPENGPADNGINLIKAEVNGSKDRALELHSLGRLASAGDVLKPPSHRKQSAQTRDSP